MSNGHIIELNGKRYDALTGEMIVDSSQFAKTLKSKPSNASGFMDVISSPTNQTQSPSVSIPQTKPSENIEANHDQDKPTAPLNQDFNDTQKSRQHQSIEVQAHAPQHSKTLMRSSVEKPVVQPKQLKKARTPAGVVPASTISISPTLQHDEYTEKRLERAQNTQRSSYIKRFEHQQGPEALQRSNHIPTETASLIGTSRSSSSYQPREYPTRTAPVRSAAGVHQNTQNSDDIFLRALAEARSHEEKFIAEKQKKSWLKQNVRLISFISGVTAIVAVLIVFTYQNMPKIDLHLASMHAGISAQLPVYQPPGYTFQNPIQYSTGYVALKFYSKNSNNSYKVVQQASNWDNQSLLENYIVNNNLSYETVHSKGQTIYIYGKGNATWVSGGVWYQVIANGHLNKDQLVTIATSM